MKIPIFIILIEITVFFVVPINLLFVRLTIEDNFLLTIIAALGLSCLFDKGIYFGLFFLYFISNFFLFNTSGLLVSFEQASISSLVS